MSVEEPEAREGWGAVSRRTLLKAGWTAPVILTVAPAVAFAASGSPAGGTSTVNPTGNHNPKTGTPTSNEPGSNVGPTNAGGPSGGLPEQQSQGPEPARINRGFTG